MKKISLSILAIIAFGLTFIGCSEAVHEYKHGDPSNTVSEIGLDINNNPVYVREIIIKRDMSYNTIFVQCTKDGIILPGTISNSYQSGKQIVHHTTLIKGTL